MPTRPVRTRRRCVLGAAAVVAAVGAPAFTASAGDDGRTPRLEGRAVLPVETYAPGPPAGAGLVPMGQTSVVINGIRFPTPSQPVEGLSGIVDGRRRGEYLVMADNGFGNKANSFDFHIRAYYVRPDFKTARGGSGQVHVGPFIEFSDPWRRIGFPIRNEAGTRVLTGQDIDPESIQRGRNGDFWIGDEFGPWLLHFDAQGRLLEAPFELPGGLTSPSHPTSPGPVPNSGGFEAIAMTNDGRTIYAILEKGLSTDPIGTRRVYEFDVRTRTFTHVAMHRVEVVPTPTNPDPVLVADAQVLGGHRLLLIERDNNGGGLNNTYRAVYEVDLQRRSADGTLSKELVVDLMRVPDPDGVSLPPIHPGDVGLGDPFLVACESIEALHLLPGRDLLLGCDNNLPNKARNPNLADDNELITVEL